jgi:hypothetical protein
MFVRGVRDHSGLNSPRALPDDGKPGPGGRDADFGRTGTPAAPPLSRIGHTEVTDAPSPGLTGLGGNRKVRQKSRTQPEKFFRHPHPDATSSLLDEEVVRDDDHGDGDGR